MLYEEVDVIQNADDATDLLISAVFLQAQFIQEHCENFLVKNMKPYVCPDMWQFADSYELKLLGEGAKKMATTKFEEDMQSLSENRTVLMKKKVQKKSRKKVQKKSRKKEKKRQKKDLKDPANGYVSEEGEVTVQVEITITAPPELEGEDAEEE
nr:hypothetical protein BaRGS_029633 [Batillaria attramentaria]